MSTAILFNGAASYIGQEAGILDLLLGNIPGVPGVLNTQDVTFVGGLSSGALMSLAFNAAFCDPPKLIWDEFKRDTLFTMTTDKVYKPAEQPPYDTSPLRTLLSTITTNVGYAQIKNLPFPSAILIRYSNLAYPGKNKNYWLTNITELTELPSGDSTVTKNIKSQQPELELVSSLMCSTAIPLVFPPQELHYKNGSNSYPIKNDINVAAKFIDGGASNDEMVFSGYQEFFDTYISKFGKFDKIYFISPNFTTIDDMRLQNLSLRNRNVAPDESGGDPTLMEKYTINFLRDLRDFNSQGELATKIYYCKPEVEGYDLLDFSKEKEQYDATIAWGQSNKDKIALDIESI